MQWQFDHHKGIVHSFANIIPHGPLKHQYSNWRKVCNILKGDAAGSPIAGHSSKLFNSKILGICGDSDGVVVAKDLYADLAEIIGDSDLHELKVVPGSHGFPISCTTDEVVSHIYEFWGLWPSARWRGQVVCSLWY